MSISVNEFKNGLTIEVKDGIWRVVEFQHVKPGKGSAFVRSKLKNLRTGAVQEMTFRSTAKVEKANIENKKMQYLYAEGDNYVFMDTTTYEQLSLPGDEIRDELKYLKENMEVSVVMYNGETLGVDVLILLILRLLKLKLQLRVIHNQVVQNQLLWKQA